MLLLVFHITFTLHTTYICVTSLVRSFVVHLDLCLYLFVTFSLPFVTLRSPLRTGVHMPTRSSFLRLVRLMPDFVHVYCVCHGCALRWVTLFRLPITEPRCVAVHSCRVTRLIFPFYRLPALPQTHHALSTAHHFLPIHRFTTYPLRTVITYTTWVPFCLPGRSARTPLYLAMVYVLPAFTHYTLPLFPYRHTFPCRFCLFTHAVAPHRG